MASSTQCGTETAWHPEASHAVEGEALALLRQMIGPGASFRQGQLDAIRTVVAGRGQVLLVQPTGWGKSAVYFIATRLLRNRGTGPTLLFSPLLALMRNQIAMARQLGLAANTINSSNREDWSEIKAALQQDRIDLILISPERLNNDEFRREALPHIARRTGLVVVDEAHCISEWGHDFRPDYRRIGRILKLLPIGVPVLCTTATANERVITDIKAQLGPHLNVLRGPLERESLVLSVLDMPSQADRLAWLATAIPQLGGSGIVYTLTVDDAERVASWLRDRGIAAAAYTGKTANDERLRIEKDLLENRLKVVVATSALGMGYDKPDLGFVIHYQSPGSPITYYQQVGRAGRGLDRAYGILLRGREDRDIQDYFFETAFPPKEQANKVIALLEARGKALSLDEIMAAVNVRKSRLESMLKNLEVDGAVEQVDRKWRRTLRPWTYPDERVALVMAGRREEQRAMLAYGQAGCLMQFLRRALDDPSDEPCGRCMNCTGEALAFEPSPETLAAARRFLRNCTLFIEPRTLWPSGLEEVSARIPKNLRLERGRALSIYNDEGWGEQVRIGKYELGYFSDELVAASVELIKQYWKPQPAPRWVTCVPSLTNPSLVPGFAERLADALGLKFLPILQKVDKRPPQKDMENSHQQVKNVLEAFTVRQRPPASPVLLVDDVIDSGWTLTVVGKLLREAGSGPVFPYVLAKAVSR